MGIETISLIIIATMLFLMACGVPLVYTTLSIALPVRCTISMASQAIPSWVCL